MKVDEKRVLVLDVLPSGGNSLIYFYCQSQLVATFISAKLLKQQDPVTFFGLQSEEKISKEVAR